MKITDADHEVAYSFLDTWEPGGESTVWKLARAFARHREAAYLAGRDSMREDAAEWLDKLQYPRGSELISAIPLDPEPHDDP